MLYQCIARIQQAAWILQFFDLRLILAMLYMTPQIMISMGSARRAVGGMVQEKGSRDRCRSWTMLHAQCTCALSSGFPISQGNAETLERWGGKTKLQLISYFISNTSAKNCPNRIVYVKTRASQKWDVFETRRRKPSESFNRRRCAIYWCWQTAVKNYWVRNRIDLKIWSTIPYFSQSASLRPQISRSSSAQSQRATMNIMSSVLRRFCKFDADSSVKSCLLI